MKNTVENKAPEMTELEKAKALILENQQKEIKEVEFKINEILKEYNYSLEIAGSFKGTQLKTVVTLVKNKDVASDSN
jgi:hypothetical protein